MSNRQKIYIGLAVSAGVCTGVGLFMYMRHRRQIASKDLNLFSTRFDTSSLFSVSKTSGTGERPASILSSFTPRRGHQYTDITTAAEADNSNTDLLRFQSGSKTICAVERCRYTDRSLSIDATVQVDFPGGSTTLTPDQAIILTRYLDDNYLNNEEKLRSVLTTIANLATFAESEFVVLLRTL